ncbi:hypothetical protein TIFTF001_021854 [Ficus carica]|uniref:Uncharacterized protein n=1 Tax=Ficus carica TaxID=3494 RepID=A0AA88ADH7_FICCA|nr:hypothetical protein TIFTF001_021854 [Ficus carica]
MGYQFVMLGPISMIINGNRIGYRFTMSRNMTCCRALIGTIDQERRTTYLPLMREKGYVSPVDAWRMIPRIVKDLANPNFLWIARIWSGRDRDGIRVGFLPSGFTVLPPAPQFLSNPGMIEEDREALLAFWGMESRTFDGTQGATVLAKWLHGTEILFRLYHVGAYLQVMFASRCLVGEARAWCLGIRDLEMRYLNGFS